jgi:N-acetylglucosaminyldiphosphoundecaprenol N-acetyl-beta-D-mannosaminyltransferase
MYLVRQGKVYKTRKGYIGNKEFNTIQVNTNNFILKNLNVPLMIFSGELQVIGDYVDIKPYESKRKDLKAGMVSLYGLRYLTGMSQDSIESVNLEYKENKSTLGDIKIILKYLVLSLLFSSDHQEEDYIEILGIKMNNWSKKKFLSVLRSNGAKTIYFLNAENINQSVKDADYKSILKNNNINLIDGSGITIACKLTGQKVQENLNGTDLFPAILEQCERKQKRVYFLGSEKGVVERMILKLREEFPGLEIVGHHHGFVTEDTNDEVIKEINSLKVDYLFVGMGTPVQEKWIESNKSQLEQITIFGVGGLFDFFSGDKKRSPVVMRELGIEWLYRLYLEPRRLFKRYVVGNVLFLVRVLNYHR